MPDFKQITAYFNIGLIVLFVLLLVGVLLAAIRGLRRGVWKSTHNMIFMFSLVLIAFITLDPFCKFVEGFDISRFWKGTLVLSKAINEQETMIYYVPITSVKETATEFMNGMYLMFNVSVTNATATNFAFAITESLLKIILFIVEIILIMTLGNLLSFITWFAIFQHFVPKIARRTVKIRWLGAIETALTYVVLTFLFLTPLTSLVNSINQSYQRNKPKSDNEMVMNIGNFVDAYNDSLFAKILFNWTVDDSGMTFDTRLFSTLTTGISDDVTFSLVGELANWTNLLVVSANGIVTSPEGQTTFDAMQLFTQDVVDSVFDVLMNSKMVTTILPIAADLALNSDFLDAYIPSRLIDVSDIDWKHEIGYVQEMVDSLFESGALDSFITKDEQGHQTFALASDNALGLFESIVYNDNFDKILNIFKAMDQSKVLSRVIPAFTYYFMNTEAGSGMKQYMPFSWEELNEFSWGYECYVLFDFLHQAITLDKNDDHALLKAILNKVGMYKPAEDDQTFKSLAACISEYIDDFNDLITGKIGTDGNPINADKNGRTLVFDKGQRIEGRHYCLFDMMIVDKALPTVIDKLFELDFMKSYATSVTEVDSLSYHKTVQKIKDKGLSGFKKEFSSVLGIVGEIAKDVPLMEIVLGDRKIESLMSQEGNFFSIDEAHVKCFQRAINKMNESELLYSALTPVVKGFFKGGSVKDSLNDLGLKSEVIVSAIDHDAKKDGVLEPHTFFSDLASLLDKWSDLANIYGIVGSNNTNDLMDKFKDASLVDSLTSILSVIYKNPLINPTPADGDTYEKNENLFGLLEFVFGMTASSGLSVKRETLRGVEHDSHTWDDEFNAIGNIIKYIANHDVTKAADMFSNGLSRSAILNLKEEGEGKVGLPALFTLVNQSYIFSSSLGPFLDDMLGSSLSGFLTDKNVNVSFSNISDWSEEGQRISNLLGSLYSLVPENDAEAKDFLTNFDMSKLANIVELNDMLHQLAYSGIFTYIDEHATMHYQFGQWFYQRVNDSMVKFTVNTSQYDLLSDPKAAEDSSWSWNDDWGIRPADGVENADPYFVDYNARYNADGTQTDTHMIAYRDFAYLGGRDNTDPQVRTDWCNYAEFTVKQQAFLSAHQADLTNPTGPYLTNDWGAYYASEQFIEDYNDVFECDEISKVCKFMTYSLRIMEKRVSGEGAGTQIPFNNLPIPILEGLLDAVNDTMCLRVCIYNFYRVAAENLLNGYSAFNLSSAYNIYMLDGGYQMFDYTNGRAARQAELDRLVDFYRVIDKAKTNGVIVGSDFDYSKMNQDGFIEDMKKAIKDFNGSYVFHRLGSSKVNSLTTFQGLFNSMLSQSSVKDVIYLGEKSPKDANATDYNSKETKIEYLVTSTFLTDAQIEAKSLDMADARNAQNQEIDYLMNSVDSLYSLKDKDGNNTTDLKTADMTKSENVDIIESLFNNLNSSNLLYDALPNSIYNIFIENNQVSIKSSDTTVDFTRVDPYYHYYFNDTAQRATPKYDAKYLAKDISGIISLLTDYQLLNSQLGDKAMANPTALKTISGEGGALKSVLLDMHNSNLFHTPARNYTGSVYYTNKFATGYTLFEEMMSQICTSVKLDTFSYDATYAADAAYGSAANKLTALISRLTDADDNGIDPSLGYHTNEGEAWSQEITSMVNLAHTAANLGTGETLDVSSFELDKLAPADVKEMLKNVNACDLVCDALPKFVNDGFTSIKLGTLTSCNDNNYATYRLGQTVYGGNDASAGEGTEIDNIYNVMASLYAGDHYLDGVDNLTSFVRTPEGETGLTGLIKYIYVSHILNTNKEMANGYDEFYVESGYNVSARGALIVNALGNDLATYIARDADKTTPASSKLQQISRMSELIALDQYKNETVKTYDVEATGIITLVKNSDGKINSTSLSSDKIKTAEFRNTTKPAILSILEVAYNATNESLEANYKRSAIASEFVSGVMNNVLENEYTKLDDPVNYPSYQYVTFSFGNDINNGIVELADYETMGKIERDGLDGMIDSLEQVESLTIATMTPEKTAALKANFAKMGLTDGNNSKIAQAIYLAEAHSKFKLLAVVENSRHEHFVPVDETSTNPNGTNNIYSSTFCFKEYGERVEAFLS